jgi:acetyl-CoA acetyltransferase family protein
MAFKDAYIPYGGYWSTPFCKWQGSFQNLHAIKFAAQVAGKFLTEKSLSPDRITGIILGITIPETNMFYGGPWLAGMIGAEHITAPMLSQACATGTKAISLAAQGIETGQQSNVLVICADRCSNGPLLSYPNPVAPGGTMDKESWVWDNFGYDPFARNSMVQTGENVAKEEGITREEQDEVTLMRYGQYLKALANEREFQWRYLQTPIEVHDRSGKRVLKMVDEDEGIYPTTADGLARLRPVLNDGTITFGSQTHPADGNCGIIVTSKEEALYLKRREDVEIRIMSYGEGKAKRGFMAKAIVPAARAALKDAGISIADITAIKTHNPFAVNDIYFSREMDVDLKDMNNYGCSLIYGHPQAPTALRLIIELIEELVERGGGYGLFDGCAAGDSAAAMVLRVNVE